MNLFTYGTLSVPTVMQAVCGRIPENQSAEITGYSCTLVRYQCFPGIQPHPEALVKGLLHLDLSAVELELLDEFESDFYDRIPLEVLTEKGPMLASAYVVNENQRDLLTDIPWDEARFIREHLAHYL